jgi:hypothetical protein
MKDTTSSLLVSFTLWQPSPKEWHWLPWSVLEIKVSTLPGVEDCPFNLSSYNEWMSVLKSHTSYTSLCRINGITICVFSLPSSEMWRGLSDKGFKTFRRNTLSLSPRWICVPESSTAVCYGYLKESCLEIRKVCYETGYVFQILTVCIIAGISS